MEACLKELQRWLDMAPTRRSAQLTFDEAGWSVRVWVGNDAEGWGVAGSLTFAVVAAILDFRKNQEG
jgi:hypothetical protein